MKTVAKLIHIVDQFHSLFLLENNEIIFCGYILTFNENSIGKNFTLDIFPRFHCFDFEINQNGNYQFNGCQQLLPNNNNNYYFKNLLNNEAVSVRIGNNFTNLNNIEYGQNFNLVLKKDYKVFDWKFDIPDNQDSNYKRIILTKKIKKKYYYAKNDNNENIYIIFFTDINNSDYLIGKSILVKMYPKFLSFSSNTIISNIVDYNFNFKIKENTIINNFSVNLNKIFIDINNSKFVLLSKNIFTYNNSNKTFNSNLIKVYIAQNYNLNKNGIFKLEQIINFSIKYHLFCYIFKYQNTMIATFIETNPNLSYNLGEYFSLNISKLTLSENIEQNDNGNFVFLAIKDNKYIFKDIVKNTSIVTLLRNSKIPTDTNVGKRFNLNYIDFLFTNSRIIVTN